MTITSVLREIMPYKLNELPWEILHHVFDYLNVVDLLQAFDQVHGQLNTILHAYTRLHLDFKSAKKSTLYFVCERIFPEQIRSLVLCEDNETPHQIKLFTSMIAVIKCVNLRSITLLNIYDAKLLALIMSHLEDHPQLHSIHVDAKHLHLNMPTCRSFASIWASMANLRTLTFFSSTPLTTLKRPLEKLTHLTVTDCLLTDFSTLLHWLPALTHLDLYAMMTVAMPIFQFIPPKLISLKIRGHCRVRFSDIENIFSRAPQLRRFSLASYGEATQLQGQRWEALIKAKVPHLTHLSLDISPEENDMSATVVLSSFETPFWKSEKRWRMACTISNSSNSCVRLFSVADCAPTRQWYPEGEGFSDYSVSPHYLFHEQCQELQVYRYPSPMLVPTPFRAVQTLTLFDPTDDINALREIIDLSTVRHLKVEAPVACPVFAELLRTASSIDQLSMKQRNLRRLLDYLTGENLLYEQIKRLNVTETLISTDIEQIGQVFPKLERVSLYIKDREDILSLLHRLPHLISSSLHWSHPNIVSAPKMEQFLREHDIASDGTYYFILSSLSLWHD